MTLAVCRKDNNPSYRLETIRKWYLQFTNFYRKLHVAFNALIKQKGFEKEAVVLKHSPYRKAILF